MKFYYLPHPGGFISFSKNKIAIYNETQVATYKHQLNISELNAEEKLYQSIETMRICINYYHNIKHKTFQENAFYSEDDWNLQ